MPHPDRLAASFYRSAGGSEPVRDWLKALAAAERKAIGEEIAYVQYKWPIGKPRVDHLRAQGVAPWRKIIPMQVRISMTS